MVTESVMFERGESGGIVCSPAPGMLNLMVSGPMVLLASLIAWRSDPGPRSAVVVTVKTAPKAERAIMRQAIIDSVVSILSALAIGRFRRSVLIRPCLLSA